MHTAWDLVHHYHGDSIIVAVPDSSFGCAITDAVLALWFIAGAPSISTIWTGRSTAEA